MTNGPIKAAGEDTGGAYALLDFVVLPEDEAPAPHVHRRTGEARRRVRAAVTGRPADPPPAQWPTNLGQNLYDLADLRVWLDGLRGDLGRIAGTRKPAPSGAATELRARVAPPRKRPVLHRDTAWPNQSLGSPGGATKIGPIGVDPPFVHDYVPP